VQGLVVQELAAFEATFSRWRADSEISRCNRHAGTEPFAVSERFGAVLAQALEIAAATNGAFDPTVAPLTEIYRATKDDPDHRLDEQALAAALPLVDYRRVTVRDGAVHWSREGIQLDLDGIVAGACADAIAARLDQLGVPGYYLDITAEVLCRGEKAPGVPWLIGVRDPHGSPEPATLLPLRNRALCTSGDYSNALVSNGKVFHHVFDPRTGRSADHGAVSVSVLARSAAVADALGTAFLVLGDAETARILPALKGHGELAVYFLCATGEGTLREVKMRWPQ